MSEQEIEYGEVLRAVEDFLCRYQDAFTCAHRDDLAQEAAIETWRRSTTLRDPTCAAAFARTVARRLRFQAMYRNVRSRAFRSLDRDAALREGLATGGASGGEHRGFCVDGRWVDGGWLAEQLDDVMRGLGPLNDAIVRGYYEGSSCRELGARYGIPPAGVKARLHRSRIRIRETFAARVAPAGRSRRAQSLMTGGVET